MKRIALAGTLATALAAALAAGAPAAPAPPKLTPYEQGLFRYAACMRKKGVKIPDPVRGPSGRYAFPQIPASVTNAPGVRQKAQACAASIPALRQRRATPAQRATFQKLADCMRRNGVQLPAFRRPPSGPRPPSARRPPSGQRPRLGGFFDTSDPKVRKALAKCRKYRPGLPRQG